MLRRKLDVLNQRNTDCGKNAHCPFVQAAVDEKGMAASYSARDTMKQLRSFGLHEPPAFCKMQY